MPAEYLDAKTIARELKCSQRHGHVLMAQMTRLNIGTGDRPVWRVLREDFEAWKDIMRLPPIADPSRYRPRKHPRGYIQDLARKLHDAPRPEIRLTQPRTKPRNPDGEKK